MPKIAIFLPSLADGGAERVLTDLANALETDGHAVDLVLASSTGPNLARVAPGVRIVALEARRVAASLAGLVRYLRRERPNALLSGLNHANLVALTARRLARVPTRVVVTVHDTLSHASRTHPRRIERAMPRLIAAGFPLADAIVAVSHDVAADLSVTTGLPRDRIEVVYNPVVGPEFDTLARAPVDDPWLAPGAPPVVLGVGRLDTQKDFSTLIRGFAHAAARHPGLLRLMILGEGAERPALTRLIEELGLTDRVRLPGYVDNPHAHIARAAVFVLSSVREGLPGVLIEALACGCPVVATDCRSGPREILEGGCVGRLVPVAEPEALADALLETLAAPPDPTTLRQRASVFARPPSVRRYRDLLLPAAGPTVTPACGALS